MDDGRRRALARPARKQRRQSKKKGGPRANKPPTATSHVHPTWHAVARASPAARFFFALCRSIFLHPQGPGSAVALDLSSPLGWPAAMTRRWDESDEHYFALAAVLAARVDDGVPELSGSGLSSARASTDSNSSRMSSRSDESSSARPEESLYKTELCRSWTASHSCQYGQSPLFFSFVGAPHGSQGSSAASRMASANCAPSRVTPSTRRSCARRLASRCGGSTKSTRRLTLPAGSLPLRTPLLVHP